MNQTIERIKIEKISYDRIIACRNVEKADILYNNFFKETHVFMYDYCLIRKKGYLDVYKRQV